MNELETSDEGTDKEKSEIKFESDEIDGQTVSFGLRFCRFVEEFGCFDISKVGCINAIVSTESIFHYVCPLWSSVESSFSLIALGNCNGNVKMNSFCQKEMMMNIERIYLVSRNDATNCHQFFSDPFYREKSVLSGERRRYFCPIVFAMEMGEMVGATMMRSKWNCAEVLKSHSQSKCK
jgi:hypothetical protein